MRWMRRAWLLLMLAVPGARLLAQAQRPMTSADVKLAAAMSTELRVIVALGERRVWVIDSAGDTLRAARVAVGSGRRLTFGRKTWNFATPVGVHAVRSIELDPVWIRPDWAYLELARSRKLTLDSIDYRGAIALAGGDSLVMRNPEIGVVRAGVFTPWPYEKDIVIAGRLYMPPLGSAYRAQGGVLGAYRLNIGSAIGFHGTLDKESIGKAVTHGCMRLSDEDLEWVYRHVPVGTPVFIYQD